MARISGVNIPTNKKVNMILDATEDFVIAKNYQSVDKEHTQMQELEKVKL